MNAKPSNLTHLYVWCLSNKESCTPMPWEDAEMQSKTNVGLHPYLWNTFQFNLFHNEEISQ